jgi:Xaa-Pro aminopeptidase
MSTANRGADEASIRALQASLAAAEFDGLLVLASSSGDVDLAPFVGEAHLGESFLVVGRRGEAALGFLVDMERDEARSTGLRLLGPAELGLAELTSAPSEPGALWERILSAAFEGLDAAPGRFAVAGHLSAGTTIEACAGLAVRGWTWHSGGELLRRWRKFKPPTWRERMSGPSGGVCAAMRAIARLLAQAMPGPGGLQVAGRPLTVGRLREVAGVELAHRGLWQPEGNIMAAGATAGVPHSRGDSSHVLQEGEPLIVDLFPRGGLFADCTRTFCVGEPPPAFVAAHDLVRRALEQARESARAGVRGWDLQVAACEIFEAAGYPTLRTDPAARRGYVHGLGHGVGYELHEYPSFRQQAGDEGLLEEGDLLTLEPGLYDPEAGFGVRLEDLCYLSPEGLVNLTPLPLDWDPGAWA